MDLDGLDLDEQVRDVPLPFLRMLDLARALAFDPQLLLLDEITAALPPDLSERVFAVMRRWKERNRSVLFISHRLAEVREHCDMCTVLRDGRDVASFVPGEGGEAQIVAAMLGEAATRRARGGAGPRRRRRSIGERPVLEAEHVGAGRQLDDVSLAVAPGEVLGLVALEGQGQETLFDVLAGNRKRRPRPAAASTARPSKPRHPFDVIRQGVVLVPADRLHALLPQRSIRENIAAPLFNRVAKWGPINGRDERRRVAEAVERLSIDTRAGEPGAPAVRRQPAEGHDRPLARPGPARDAAVRPDARHRRRHEAPGVRPRAVARRRGRGDRHVHQRAARGRRSCATARPCCTAAASSPSCPPTPARTRCSRAAHGLRGRAS